MRSLRQWKQLKLNVEYPDTSCARNYSSEEFIASRLSESPTGQIRLMESICERDNMRRAIKRVIKRKGAPGVDGMTVRKLKRYFKRHRAKIERALLDGTYTPLPVRQKEIGKPGGGVRLLGIPTVLDRVIQSRRWREPGSGIIPSRNGALDSGPTAPNMTRSVSIGSMCGRD